MSAKNKKGEGRQFPADVHWYGSDQMFIEINRYAMDTGQTISEAHRAIWKRILRRYARRLAEGLPGFERTPSKTESSRGSENGRRGRSARTSGTRAGPSPRADRS